MATNLAIDPDLLDRAVEVSGERTKKAVVTKALQEFIARREQKRVVELMGKLEWDDSFNCKAERLQTGQSAPMPSRAVSISVNGATVAATNVHGRVII